MKNKLKLSGLSCAVVLATTLSGFCDDSLSSAFSRDESMHVKNCVPGRVNKAKGLIGMKICNQKNEYLGKVKDMVLDLESGRIAYVVLSTGGIRPKYLALPPSALAPASDGKHLVLNADREKVLGAVGFKKNDWPNMATPSWGAEPFWQTPDKASHDDYEYRTYDKKLDTDGKSKFEPKGQDSIPENTPDPYPTPTPPDE